MSENYHLGSSTTPRPHADQATVASPAVFPPIFLWKPGWLADLKGNWLGVLIRGRMDMYNFVLMNRKRRKEKWLSILIGLNFPTGWPGGWCLVGWLFTSMDDCLCVCLSWLAVVAAGAPLNRDKTSCLRQVLDITSLMQVFRVQFFPIARGVFSHASSSRRSETANDIFSVIVVASGTPLFPCYSVFYVLFDAPALLLLRGMVVFGVRKGSN